MLFELPFATRKDRPLLLDFLRFLYFLLRYVQRKFVGVLALVGSLILWLISLFTAGKFQITRKLIVGRGSLQQPASHLAVLTLAVAIFLAGNVFSGTPLVRTTVASERGADFTAIPDTLAAPATPDTKTSDFIRKEAITYIVQPGDTLSTIGTAYRMTYDAIRYANNLDEGALLTVGQKLIIPPVDGVLHTVVKGDTVESLAKKYDVSPQAIVDFNYLFEPFALAVGDKVMVPEAKIPQPVKPAPAPYYAVTPSGPTGPVSGGTGQFLWPVVPRYITQYFSSYHNGIDIGGSSPIFATDGGRVVAAGWNPWGLGNSVKIDHGNGYSSTYGHLSRIDVSVGQNLVRGQVIGQTGNTGHSFGTHLHFIIQQGNRTLNPLSVL